MLRYLDACDAHLDEASGPMDKARILFVNLRNIVIRLSVQNRGHQVPT